MTTIQRVELGVLGPLQVRQFGLPVAIPGAKPRAVLTMLGLHGGTVVAADTLVELLWGDDAPRTAAKALQTHISGLRRALGDGFVLTQGSGWTLNADDVDAIRYTTAARLGRDAMAAGDASQAVVRFDEALKLWRGAPELPDGRRGESERTRWVEGHAALVEDRADALLATGRAAELIGELEAAIADAPLRERRWSHLMLALYRAGRQGEALAAYQRVRTLLADELGIDPGSDLRRLEAAIVAQDISLELPTAQHVSSVMRAVTFLLTDIEGSTAAWEADADAMAAALARHDEIVEQVVTFRGGRLIKTRGEGDATFSVFDRPSAAASAAVELQEAIANEPWALAEQMRIRIALHTGEVEFRDGDYFGRAVNRAARLRSLATGGQTLCSGATAELVIDTLSDDVVLADLGLRQLKNLARPEHVFELRLEHAGETRETSADAPIDRPGLPAVLTGPGPFVGRGSELDGLLAAWQTTLTSGTRAVLIAGEPGVGKTRLAGEWSRRAHDDGAVVLYGRCDEDLGAPYQPFAEALRTLVPCLGVDRLRGLRGVESLLALVPGLTDVLPDLTAAPRADADTERYALFDAVVALLRIASDAAPVVLVLDDLHWAAKPTLLLLRHLLRFGEHSRVQIVGTYRSTDLDRAHPLAAMLADLNRDGSADRLTLAGLNQNDVTAYVTEAGYDDEDLARALTSVTGGNPFFLIEALRHVDESGGHWDPSSLPQGVREAVSRRLSRLPAETNKALAAAAVVGSRFAVELVERVVDDDLVDAFDEAGKAGIVIEEPGGRYRFNHALVRQSLLAELPSVRRMRLHQKIAAALESEPGADDELLAELAYHYFECAWAGNAGKAVEYCRRAGDQAMARLGYEGAADLYDKALHALEELDDEMPDRDDLQAELLVARCEALLAAGDVGSATGAVAQLQSAAGDSARLAAWGTCFDGELSMLTDPERLDEIEAAVAAAAETLSRLEDAAGEAKAHTVRAGCLARLGRVGACETALDQALTAARRARDHRRVNSVLAGAPLAALWGPNPVPRAGGRCLDVVRLLRITTGSPVVEATSTRCQGVLDAFRGRASAGRQLIDSARRALKDLGMRHAVLEVEQFAGIVELVADDAAAAEVHLRKAYNGFRRMRLDADTAETAALLARACLALGRDDEADELCTESERLAGHAFKAAIAWRAVRAQLLARAGSYDEARRVAEEAVAIAERTDALVDHGDARMALAVVLGFAGDAGGSRAAAERAVQLYEEKGAAALAEKAATLSGGLTATRFVPEAPSIDAEHRLLAVSARIISAFNRGAWDEVEQLLAPQLLVESRRKIVGASPKYLTPRQWTSELMQGFLEVGLVLVRHAPIAVRGERLVLGRLELCSDDSSSGAPKEEVLELLGLDDQGRVALQVIFGVEDMKAAMDELDRRHAQFERHVDVASTDEPDNACALVAHRLDAAYDDDAWNELGRHIAAVVSVASHRRIVGREPTALTRSEWLDQARSYRDTVGSVRYRHTIMAMRGQRLALTRLEVGPADATPGAPRDELLQLYGVDEQGCLALQVWYDVEDIDVALAELDRLYIRFEAEESAAPAAEPENDCVRVIRDIDGVCARSAWDELTQLFAATISLENRRKIVGSAARNVSRDEWVGEARRFRQAGIDRVHRDVVTLGGDRLALFRTRFGTADESVGAPEDQLLHLMGLDEDGRFALHMSFDLDDMDAALAELDAQHSRFEAPVRRAPLENAAARAEFRFNELFTDRCWDDIAAIITEDIATEERRRGLRRDSSGRAALIEECRVIADLGVKQTTSEVVAVRGDRIVLSRVTFSGRDQRSDAFHTVLLRIAEVDERERFCRVVTFEPEDIDAAIAELDARYLAGEAAPHAHAWSVLTASIAAFNRREFPSWASDLVGIDHRRVTAFEPGDQAAYVRAGLEQTPDLSLYVEAVHRLSDRVVALDYVANGRSPQGFAAEWRGISVTVIDGDRVARMERFDEADLDQALARFDELGRGARRPLENTATVVYERVRAAFAAQDWKAMVELLSDGSSLDDRRHTVNGGVVRGRDACITEMRAIADIGVNVDWDVLATRGSRLALAHVSFSHEDPGTDAIRVDVVDLVEIDGHNRVAARVAFDRDDLGAAFAELDARYLAGEAAPYAGTWSVVAGAYAGMSRGEMPGTTADLVNVDHRRVAAMAPDDGIAYLHASWDLAPHFDLYIESVHRLTDLGAVFTRWSKGVSREGFEAEWRAVDVITVDGDLISRGEIFDETDLDAALARFDELNQPTSQLDNTATRLDARFQQAFTDRDWAAMADVLDDDFVAEDRRRVVNTGIRHGRDAKLADMRATADLGTRSATSTPVAIRGQCLALMRIRLSGRDQRSEAFHTEMLGVVEINAENRMAARILFDPDDLDSALEELDVRYPAGEAAPYAQTWSRVVAGYAAFNRREVPATTPDMVSIDRRRGTAFAPGDMIAYVQAAWDLEQDVTSHIKAVHRLNHCGVLVTHATHATSDNGFEADWSFINLVMLDDDLVSRVEIYDESDLDAALARFDELGCPAATLGNTATRVIAGFNAAFASRRWDDLSALLAADFRHHDHRRGLHHEAGDAVAFVAELRAVADLGVRNLETVEVIAVRGERLALSTSRVVGRDTRPDAFRTDLLGLVELDPEGNRIAAFAVFDLDDFDSAIAELDARYLVGDAKPHAQTYSSVAQFFYSVNRREIPATAPDFVDLDRRSVAAAEPGELEAYLRAAFEDMASNRLYVEYVHRLTDSGAVVTQVATGTTQAGLDVSWRVVDLVTVDGELVNRLEIFDEIDVDAALARFDELSRPARNLANTASRIDERCSACFAAGDWTGMAALLADDVTTDDRKRIVNGGIRRGRTPAIASMQAVAGLGLTMGTPTVIAIRGERVCLQRVRMSGRETVPGAAEIEMLSVVEVGLDERIVARVVFDLDDVDAAFAELESRYLAGEAAPYAQTWSVMVGNIDAFNAHELPAWTPDKSNVEHRKFALNAPGEMPAFLRSTWNQTPDVRIRVEAVHRLGALGAVVSTVATGSSQQGFAGEWRVVTVSLVDGDRVGHSEQFDEDDLDAALARFDELSRPTPNLANEASRLVEQAHAYFVSHEWDSVQTILADDCVMDDRRRGVNAGVVRGAAAQIQNMRASADLGVAKVTSTVVATRGERLVLTSVRYSGGAESAREFVGDALQVFEANADGRLGAIVLFDEGDIDAAFEELDACYIAGEVAAYAHTWSIVVRNFAAFNNRQPPETTADWVTLDHRRTTSVASEDLPEFIRSFFDDVPDATVRIEQVHRVGEFGAVMTQATRGTSREGFEAEWRELNVTILDGELVSRCEHFAEEDLDAALARFDELSGPAADLKNTATGIYKRWLAAYAARDWDAMTDVMAEGVRHEDRRRVVNGGTQRGRAAVISNMQAIAAVGVTNIDPVVIATRGERLALARQRVSGDKRPDAYGSDVLIVIEVDAESRFSYGVAFDSEDVDTAFEELDARYTAGEAAAHAHTWNVIARVYAVFNRHELPSTTTDLAIVDHRSPVKFETGELFANVRAVLDQVPGLRIAIEAVHRVTANGAVVTHAAHGVSQEGFDAEWRVILLYGVDGDLINRYELFDEDDLDSALARFDELSRTPPQNSAANVYERLHDRLAEHDWAAMGELFSDDFAQDDRRRVVGAGVRCGREAQVDDLRTISGLGLTHSTSEAVATRGWRLLLTRARISGSAGSVDAARVDVLEIVETDVDDRISALVIFDADDVDGAFAELDARYVAGEAAPHASAWDVITRSFAAFGNHERPSTAIELQDHRKFVGGESTDAIDMIRAAWNMTREIHTKIEVVHRLNDRGAVITQSTHGTSQEGFAFELRAIDVVAITCGAVDRCDVYDESDLESALTRFDELNRPTSRLQNAATGTWTRITDVFNRRDVDSMVALTRSDGHVDDRRTGVRDFRDGPDRRRVIETLFEYPASWWFEIKHVAIRGTRLCLSHQTIRDTAEADRPVTMELLTILEVDADGLAYAFVNFDAADVDAAIDELDALYVAGEGKPHARAWSVVKQAYAAVNRHETPNWTKEFTSIDHRRGIAVPPGELKGYVLASWADTPGLRVYVEAVHRLSDLGVLVTHVTTGAADHGFEAEWRIITLSVLDGDFICRSEMFDEDDLDAAIKRFNELLHLTSQPKNAAGEAVRRIRELFAARDWDGMRASLSENFLLDDRRRTVNGGTSGGRDKTIADLRTGTDLGFTHIAEDVVAVRGERLVLTRARYSVGNEAPETYFNDVLHIIEIDAKQMVTATVVFDPDDLETAITELDARYAAGEAAPYARTWSVITQATAAFSRHETPPTTADAVNIDHRHVAAFEPGDFFTFVSAASDLVPGMSRTIEAVHRLSDVGAVVTGVAHGSTQAGFDAEWRAVVVATVEGDLINRYELFDEADLDTALARFDELNLPAPRLNNAAIRAARKFGCFAVSDCDSLAETFADDFVQDDRRRVVGAGVRHGRDAEIDDLRAFTELGLANVAYTILAIRGDRLVLARSTVWGGDTQSDGVHTDMLTITEVEADGRITALVIFDSDDLDAALAELEERYLAGEAAAHAHTWSVITQGFNAIHRLEIPATTSDFADVDHRSVASFGTGDLKAYLEAAYNDMAENRLYVESVHRLTELGAVVTHVATGKSHGGLELEWRMVDLVTIDGELADRIEVFDEADLDTALARFDQLGRPAGQLTNATSRIAERLWMHFEARDWAAMSDLMSDDTVTDDRRRVVGSIVLRGCESNINHYRALASVGAQRVTTTIVATRGDNLALGLFEFYGDDRTVGAFRADALAVVEINDAQRITARAVFDPDDVDAAYTELDARYLAGEAAAHAHTWSAIVNANAVFNRREMPPTTPDWTNVDHRRGGMAFAPGDQAAYMRATWDVATHVSNRIVAVHRLDDRGVVFTQFVSATSADGFTGEWRDVVVITFDGDLIDHCEVYDEDDLDAALARFDELA